VVGLAGLGGLLASGALTFRRKRAEDG
jgi:LPXTG-motif cell wall-anchored protein